MLRFFRHLKFDVWRSYSGTSARVRTARALASIALMTSAAAQEPEPATRDAPPEKSTEPASPAPVPEARGSEEEEVLKSVIIKKTAEAEGPVEGPLHPALPPPPEPPPPLSRSLLLYVSLRLNLSYYGKGSWEATDGASRVGAIWLYQVSQDAALLGRVELGVNAVDQFSALVTPDASSAEGRDYTVFNPRLYYGGFEFQGIKLLAGKNWSAYYDVAGLTDSFIVGGGKAVGVYNAGTDGGGSGTGRADQVLQLRGRHLRWTYGLQAQYRTSMPVFTDERFDYGLGIGLLHKTTEGLSFGAAYNLAVPAEITDAMQAQGLGGDDTSLAFGMQFRREKLTLATTFAVSRNHETDDQDTFLKARGWEVYTRYDLTERLRSMAGVNRLEPDDADYAGAFKIEQYIFGIQYAFGDPTFDRMLYVGYTFDEGRLADGTTVADLATVGARWGWSW